MTESAIAALLGALTWSFLEYLLHRFVFHAASPRMLGAREHRQHHANPDYFAPAWQKALAAVGVTALLGPVAVAIAGSTGGAVYTLSFVATYVAYEVLHRRAHTHPPRGRYGRWRRRNHFAHHFRDPRRGHGVTTPVWDAVFGTRLPHDRIVVPRRLAMRWLVDGEGALRDEFAGDYALAGGRARDEGTARADTDAAMANRAPDAGGAEPA